MENNNNKAIRPNQNLDYLIVFITDSALKISTKEYNIIFTQNFNFVVKQADLSFFAEGK